jgi:integrase
VPEPLDDNVLRQLKPSAERVELADGTTPPTGLRLRIYPTGAKVWSVWYRTKGGQQRRHRIGTYPNLSLAAARKAARKINVEVDAGHDPQGAVAAKRQERRARGSASKFSDLIDDFVRDQQAAWRPSTKAGWLRYIEADIKPGLGKRIPAEITADDVLDFVNALKRKRGPVSVARCYEITRRIFRWAAAHRKIKQSPCLGLEAKEIVAKAKMGDRTYSDPELRAIIAAAQCTEYADIVPLIAYTATRNEETRTARWSHIDRKAKLWAIPSGNTKADEAHRVPLSKGALAILDGIEETKADFVFSAPTKAGCMDASQKTIKEICNLSGVADFKLHDLRRTVRQRLKDMGVAQHVGEAIIGHLPPKIVRNYTPQWEPLAEMTRALEAWSTELQAILAGRKRKAVVLAGRFA